MRTKSFAMFAMSALLATSVAYVAPAMADETSSGMPMEQMMLADNSSGSATQAPTDAPTANGQQLDQSNIGANDSNTGTQQADASTSNNASQGTTGTDNTSNTGSTTDQGGPDTATGDDDY